MYDTLLPAYVHVFQTVIPRNRLPRMFSMNQARYSTVILLRSLCKFAILRTATTCQFSVENFPKTRHERSLLHPQKKSRHTQVSYRKIIHRNWTFTHKKNRRRKLIMTSTLSNLKCGVQKTTIERDVGLRTYYSVSKKCRLQTADCRLQTGYKMQTRYKMKTADCRPQQATSYQSTSSPDEDYFTHHDEQ